MHTVCQGLPFDPSPGDILQHESVPFDTSAGCNSYLDSWCDGDACPSYKVQGNASGRMRATGEPADKTKFEDRGEVWGTTLNLLQRCIEVPECKGLVNGMKGKEVQDCLHKCTFEFGEEKLEEWVCDYAAAQFTGGIATFFCNNVLAIVMGPVNKFLNNFIEQPIIDAMASVEHAIASAGRRFKKWLGFGSSIALVV